MSSDDSPAARADHLRHAVEHAAHLLPAQGPVSTFVHHNTLHAFEHLPFETAVVEASELYGTEPWLTEERYREKLARGRILLRDLRAVLDEDLGAESSSDSVAGFATRGELRLAMLAGAVESPAEIQLDWILHETELLHRLRTDLTPEARENVLQRTRRWFLSVLASQGPAAAARLITGQETDADATRRMAYVYGIAVDRAAIQQLLAQKLEAVAARALWHAAVAVSRRAGPRFRHDVPFIRHRDFVKAALGRDADALANPLIIRFAGGFLDCGLASWSMPLRERGLLSCFLAVYGLPGGSPDPFSRALAKELARLRESSPDAAACAVESLDLLGVPEAEWSDFVARTLLPLRGWAGMIHQLENRPDRAPAPAPPASLVDFLAIRLICDRIALAQVLQEPGLGSLPLSLVRSKLQSSGRPAPIGIRQRAYPVFHVAQLLGLSGGDIRSLSDDRLTELLLEIESFDGLERRRVFHQAFERRHRVATLDALASRPAPPSEAGTAPGFQAVFCIDEREESLRRHLEEVAPSCETFGSAGFFGVAMYYRGLPESHPRPLCPIGMRPRHLVCEVPEAGAMARPWLDRARRAFAASLAWALPTASRSLARGTLLSALVGWLAVVPLILRVLFPGVVGWLRRRGAARHRMLTRLALEREAAEGQADDAIAVGFTVEEMAEIVLHLLEETGLANRIAPLVLVVGHGSSSLNNPHESAYDCGACGGGRGGPNARAFAQMANTPAVRDLLRQRGSVIPQSSHFVGLFHDTCDDSLAFKDVGHLPPAARSSLAVARKALDEARMRNAHERSRRFENAPLWLSPAAALEHVETRSEDLAQPRPECGHATNAVCVVGRRARTRGLFLDRRAFLVSYDSTIDPDGTILERLLGAVLPVGAGINLEYFFSYVDSAGFGCGTKLPHNITGLLGVMDGHASDLRSGLPWQMVEIHEPIRLLLVVETTARKLLQAIPARGPLRRLVANRWIQLVSADPESGKLSLFRETGFEPYLPESDDLPSVLLSSDWYGMRRDHLGYARVGAAVPC